MSLAAFHPTVRGWFESEVGTPTPPQVRGWPAIRSGKHVLIAAPTGSGKTLAAFLAEIDALLRLGSELPDETRVLYVSPLKALGNDVQKNLQSPLARLRELDPSLPEIRVMVRSGDTPQSERAAMVRRPPHILVTTPESLYILLTSESGRAMLRTVRVAIVDEIHAMLGDKRGSHLALSLERLAALAGDVQRIGLSATQKPIEDVGRFLGGVGREVELIDEGHLRRSEMQVEIPPSPLETVCSHETWGEIYARVVDLVREHRTTLIFVTTRKLAERVSAEIAKLLGPELVACHHSSLSKERRLDAEQRLKSGQLRALVATASLELGIDVGDVDLVVQIGTTRSIAAFLQRVGRSGHGVGRTPKGVMFPLTQDELVESAAILRAVRRGILDRTPQPRAPLDVLAQQIVAACAAEVWATDDLYERYRRAWPFRDLERKSFDAAVELHANGRAALLHRDGVNGRLRGTRRARMTAITCGGAIPDTTQYRVLQEPSGTFIGQVDEDFAVESTAGDVFQLGATSWRVLKVEPGVMRVADAAGTPPSLPFWIAEAPARTRELSSELCEIRENGRDIDWLERECGFERAPAEALAAYLEEGVRTLGAMPTQRRMVLERFFDESGGMQLVLHSPYGGRINRALGLALRKRFCRSFGFELQAAANEDSIVLSLGPQHSFELAEVFDYLRARSAREVLVQALLVAPMFEARWRWNATRSLAVERFRSGGRVPAQILRMRAADLLAASFPDVAACGENLPAGDIAVPYDHPIVAQTVDDCLHEAMDVDGMLEVLRGLEEGTIERVAVDVPEPSAFARSVLTVRPYGFLDDAPLEERRTQAVYARRTLSARDANQVGALDPAAIARVREEAWPDPRDAEEVHEALSWMGYVTLEEARPWQAWIDELVAQRRVVREGERWLAVDSTRDPKEMLRGRLEALGPIHSDDPLLFELEREGAVLRIQIDGGAAWCERRLLARIQRYTLDTLRREIQPVSAETYARFLATWQHVDEKLDGPGGLFEVLRQLAGFEAPLAVWERRILPARVNRYRAEWLDQLGLSGRIAWGRLWGAGRTAVRVTPIAFFPREETDLWLGFEAPPTPRAQDETTSAEIKTPSDAVDASSGLTWPARAVLDALTNRGAMFTEDLVRATKLLPVDVDRGLAELIGLGRVTSDSFASARHLFRPSHRRREVPVIAGRWSLLDRSARPVPEAETIARVLLRRYGVVFRAAILRERHPIPWRDVVRALRLLELRGEVRGGRFVERFSGEQYALPEAIPMLRKARRDEPEPTRTFDRFDPLHLPQILEPKPIPARIE